MRSILVCLTLLSLLYISHGIQLPVGLYRTVAEVYDEDDGSQDCDSSKGLFHGCSKDCTQMQICIADTIVKVNCGSSTGGQLYCDKIAKSCSSKESLCNKKPQCLQDGLFPDPLNCKNFFECKENSIILNECLGNANYDILNQKCSSGAFCYSFSSVNGLCKGKVGSFIPHPRNTAYYVLCSDSPSVLKCPDEHVYNPSLMTCEFKCKREGVFTNPSHKDCFYLCQRQGTLLIRKEDCCNDGMHLNTDKMACEENEENNSENE